MSELPPLTFALTPELQFILNLGVAVAAALAGGWLAVRFGQPPIVGYLLAGVVIGPFTPGFVGDQEQIGQLAELGVVLLLFALGVEFSLRELVRVRSVAVPGAIVQVALITGIGTLVALPLGLSLTAAAVIGAAIAISSTIVVLKVLVERGELDSVHGRVAVGWMVVQDLLTIVLIAMLEPLAGADPVAPLVLALARTAVFLALAWLVGTRLLPLLFLAVSRLGSPELFLLTVFATALLAAVVSSAVFGLSLALGAFVAGLIVAESDLSHQAAGEVIPFRDLFAVLFFVSVGMLLDPAALAADWPALILLALVAILGKALVSIVVGRILGLPMRSAILLGATVAQVGEFSFLLAERALSLGILDARGYNLVLATAVVSIVATPPLVRGGARLVDRLEHRAGLGPVAPSPPVPGALPNSRGELAIDGDAADRTAVVVLGGGRVGRIVARAVRTRGFRCVVVDRDQATLDELTRLGAATLYGDAANPAILRRAGLDRARLMVVAIGDPLTARLAVERAREINPRLTVVARARGGNEIAPLRTLGVTRFADPELEAALELTRASRQRMGVSGPELAAITGGLRRSAYGVGLEAGQAAAQAPPEASDPATTSPGGGWRA